MSKPMTTSQIKSQLKKWGIPYREYGNWETHNRGNRGNGWSNLNGLIQHHTGSDSQGIESFLRSGSANLPGPLCHFGNDSSGRIDLIGWGRANHAGLGDSAVLDKVISENYTGILRPKKRNYDGNGRFYGVENYYSGSHGMSKAQYHTAVLLGAAICDFHGWSAKSVIGHGEWSTTKWDPGYASNRMMDMNAFRHDTQDALNGKPNQPKPDKEREMEWLALDGYMPELHYGDNNWHVDWLQRNLNRFLSSNIKVDGYYGNTTANAVDWFYKKYLDYDTKTNGRIFGADGWRRVLSVAKNEKGQS